MNRLLLRLYTWHEGRLFMLLPALLFSAATLLFSSPAFAAQPAPTQTTTVAQAATAVYPSANAGAARAQISSVQPRANNPPGGGNIKCDANTDPTDCANKLTGQLGGMAQAIYQVGVWAAIVVAILVIIWTTPSGIFAAASSNSKVVSQVIIRLGIIAALILLALNSWTILQWFLGGSSSQIQAPSLPTICDPTNTKCGG
jgi:hypothetical protein